jgi:hypothetical protein
MESIDPALLDTITGSTGLYNREPVEPQDVQADHTQ